MPNRHGHHTDADVPTPAFQTAGAGAGGGRHADGVGLGSRHRSTLLRLRRNWGFAVGVNRGLAVSDAEVVCIQNNDTIMPPDGSDVRLLACLETHPDAQTPR